MRPRAWWLTMVFVSAVRARAPASPADDSWKALSFLEGTWEAKATGKDGVSATGTYSFRPELGNHILARHSRSGAGCKGPAGFDCDHGGLLYVFSDAPGHPLQAIYFDNGEHVIHYAVTTPDATTAMFLSEASQSGPQFRLMYTLRGGVMTGTFGARMPGQAEWSPISSGADRNEVSEGGLAPVVFWSASLS